MVIRPLIHLWEPESIHLKHPIFFNHSHGKKYWQCLGVKRVSFQAHCHTISQKLTNMPKK